MILWDFFSQKTFFAQEINAVFTNDGMPQSERLIKLNQITIQHMKIHEDTGGRNL